VNTTVTVTTDLIHRLDISSVAVLVEEWIAAGAIATKEQHLQIEIDYLREPQDPRELSEISEIRLWFVRLDASYPWLPFILKRETDLIRYAAMLVPHQFSPTEGIQFNPEALEIFVMHKIFILMNWMKQQGIQSRTKIKFITQMFGYELDDAFFDLLEF
jgi:hypothetical protein